MALIKCPECRKRVSDQCDRCPGCGYPIASNLDAIEPNKNCFAMATALIKRMMDTIRKRKQIRIALIAAGFVFIILIIAGIVIYKAMLPQIEAYGAALELLEEESYQDALQAFEELHAYKDSQGKADVCKFQLALELEGSGEYAEAARLYKELGNYIHRYREFEAEPVAAADKAKEAAFHHIARDVRGKTRSLWGNAYSRWSREFSNYRYTFDDRENIVVTFHFYAYYPSVVPKVENRDVVFDMIHIKLSDYDDLLGLTDENYEQVKSEWIVFMEKNYAD